MHGGRATACDNELQQLHLNTNQPCVCDEQYPGEVFSYSHFVTTHNGKPVEAHISASDDEILSTFPQRFNIQEIKGF